MKSVVNFFLIRVIRIFAEVTNYFLSVRKKNSRTVAKLVGTRNAPSPWPLFSKVTSVESTPAFFRAALFRIARMARAPHKARMFALGGDAFPNDTQSLHAALARGVSLHGGSGDAIRIEGGFPSLDALRMNLTGVRLNSRAMLTSAAENAAGGFFARAVEITAEPALLASIPIQLRLHAEDCVVAFGTAADGTRAALLESCASGKLDVAAATADLEAALLALAREAASGHGAEVKSVSLTLEAESPHAIAVTAVAIAKAMFFTATLTMRGRLALDEGFNLRLSEATCTGDGMLANLAAAQLRPRLAEWEGREFSLRSFLPAGLRVRDIALTGGAALRIQAAFGGK